MSYGLTLAGVALPEDRDPLGVCRIAPTPVVAFEAGASAPPEVPLWRESLPASPDEAETLLAEQSAALQQRQAVLADAQRELASLADATAEVSFAAPLPTRYPRQMAALQRDLLTFQPAAESFGLFARPPAFDVHLAQQWHDFVSQVDRIVAHYARVETVVAQWGNVGRTVVTWGGDFHTTWQDGVPTPIRRVHLKAVNVALLSRMTLIHMAGIIIGGAAGLALKAASLPPGGQVLLLPSVWRFVKDVLAELDSAIQT